MANLVGIWDLESSDNFDAFLKSMGVNFLLRKAAAVAKVTQILSINGDVWTIKLVAPVRTRQYDFRPGSPYEFEEEFLEDKKTMVITRIDSANKMTQEQRDPTTNALLTIVTRELIDGKLIQRMTHNGVTAIRIFARRA